MVATHKHPTVRAWLQKHPRFHMHFTPTSASWMNMVERFFRSLSTDRLERGVFKSVPELIAAIDEYIAVHNENHNPLSRLQRPMTSCRKSFAPTAALVQRKTKHYTSHEGGS
jgi:hypothetical protein